MSALVWLAVALGLVVSGFAGGIKWHAGQDAIAAQAAEEARKTDAKLQQQLQDKASGRHLGALARLNNQLGDAREEIASLHGRACLDPRTVGVLNATGVVDGAAAAGQPASAASAAAAGANDRFATDRDVAGYIALCRTRYGEVSNQLNEILDIEDRRHPPAPP